jgi:hypothetical protein
MITLKELGNYYKYYSMDNGKTQNLSTLEPIGLYTPHKFLCHITKVKNGVYKVGDFEPTNNIDVLVENQKEYTKSLKYNSEFYNPNYRKGYFEEMVVHEYLTNLGFKVHDNDTYSYNFKDAYGKDVELATITISGLSDLAFGCKELNDTVTVIVHLNENSWMSVKDVKRNADTILETIQGIIKPLFISTSFESLKIAEKLENVAIVMNINSGFLNVETEPYKEKLIKQLEDMLKVLKNGN